MGERRRRAGEGRPMIARRKSTFIDFNEGVPQRLCSDGVWRDAPDTKKAQLEELPDGSALYFVLGGERVAYRHDGQWVPMRPDVSIQDYAPGTGTVH
jgi:hypothetical protein